MKISFEAVAEGQVASTNLPTHLPSLDGIRGLAIALVIVHNVNVLHDAVGIAGRSLQWLAGIGWFGVQLFFVLSGFLITRSLFDTQGARNFFSVFYWRRALRVFPLYYATLFSVFVLWSWLGDRPAGYVEDARHQVWLWLFLSNWSAAFGLGGESLSHFWSLAVEEQFYLVWPFVIKNRTPQKMLAVCSAVVGAALLVRVGMWVADAPWLLIYTLTISRMDALAAGAAAAALVRMPGMLPRLVERRNLLLWAALVTLLLGKLIPHAYWKDTSFGSAIGYTILSIAFALFVLGVACGDAPPLKVRPQILRWRALRVLGKYSYALYILHPLVNGIVGAPLLQQLLGARPPNAWQSLLYVAGVALFSLLLAWLSWHLIEKRFLAMKRYFVAQLPAARAASG